MVNLFALNSAYVLAALNYSELLNTQKKFDVRDSIEKSSGVPTNEETNILYVEEALQRYMGRQNN